MTSFCQYPSFIQVQMSDTNILLYTVVTLTYFGLILMLCPAGYINDNKYNNFKVFFKKIKASILVKIKAQIQLWKKRNFTTEVTNCFYDIPVKTTFSFFPEIDIFWYQLCMPLSAGNIRRPIIAIKMSIWTRLSPGLWAKMEARECLCVIEIKEFITQRERRIEA